MAINFSNVTGITINNQEVKSIDINGVTIWQKESPAPTQLDWFYVEDASGSDNTLTITRTGTSETYTDITVEKSTDGTTWTTLGTPVVGTPVTATVPADGKLYLRCSTNTWAETYNVYNSINCSGNYNIGGNIMSLFYGSSFDGTETAFPTNDGTTRTGRMFYGSSTLISAADLSMPATTLSPSSTYFYMFYGCTGLTTVPSDLLPATTLTDRCYAYMFQGCSSLTTAPLLQATSIPVSGYECMFRNCTSLTTAPALPATTLNTDCYYFMFAGSGLTSVPSLPATNLGNRCYWGMFYECTGLTTVPSNLLPATTLTQNCYSSMFNGCSNLTTAPNLPATTLAQYCYYAMFQGCSSLSSINCQAETFLSGATTNWVYGVASTGTFNRSSNATFWDTDSPNGIPSGWTVTPALPSVDWTEPFYIKNETNSNITITFAGQGSSSVWNEYIDTSLYKAGLTETTTNSVYRNTSYSVGIGAGQKLYVGMKDPMRTSFVYNYNPSGTSDKVNITSTGYFSIGGNIASLAWGGVSFLSNNNVGYTNSFAGAFQGNTNLISAEKLLIPSSATFSGACQSMFKQCTNLTTTPTIYYVDGNGNDYSEMFSGCTRLTTISPITATSLVPYCFMNMFQACTGLTTVSSNLLPSTSLASYCYANMFSNCTSLTTPVNLPATTAPNDCYEGMYYNCTSLTTLPTISATTLYQNCYRTMFYGCTGLTSIPQNYLPATIMASYCYYQMFSRCTGLTTVPSDLLPSASLNTYCYYGMFEGCNHLTSLPSLPAATLWPYCYSNMFKGTAISSTASISNVTSLSEGCFQSMYMNCVNITTVSSNYLPFTSLQESCYAAMFSGCTGLTNTPNLPATSLAQTCYSNMFRDCTSLTSNNLPTLPATTMATQCYSLMFYGCTGLTTIPSNYLPATTLAQYCYSNMFQGCTNITSTPNLPATTLYQQCYANMFDGCTSLTTTATMSATTLANFCCSAMYQNCTGLTTITLPSADTLNQSCYQNMFKGCTGLTSVPQLPAMTLAPSCYNAMFQDCTNLTTVPSNMLPATTLATYCYQYMFRGCTSLTTAPDLLATAGVNSCYYYMFYGCSSLNYVKCNLATYNSSFTTNWLTNVASTGTFVKNPANSSWTRNTSGIPSGWTIEENINYNEPFYYELTSAPAGSVYVTVQSTGTAPTVTNWQYSYDNSTWTSFDPANDSPELQVGKTYFRASAPSGFASSANDYWRFGGIAFNHNIGGNLCSLVYGSSFTNQHSITNPSDYFFSNLFASDTLLNTSENLILPDETSTKMYYSTFASCTIMTAPPMKMPTALSTYCFESMFQGCTSLYTVTPLTATTMVEGCYMNMFNGCGFTTAFNLKATTLAENCYRGMFKNCRNLSTPPVISASAMADYCCAEMFENCRYLSQGVRLSNVATFATGCFYNMFKNCTGMTQLNGSNYIGLNGVKTVPNYAFYGMFYGCSAYTQNNRITVTAVGDYGMAYMFYGCNITGSTYLNLRAASPGTAAYINMFENCTALKNIKCLMSTYDATITADWIKGVTKTSGTFTRLTSNTSWVTGVDSGIPSGWTVRTATS